MATAAARVFVAARKATVPATAYERPMLYWLPLLRGEGWGEGSFAGDRGATKAG